MPRTRVPDDKSGNINLTLRITEDILRRIDERRRVEIDIPTRTTMIKRILKDHLDAWEKSEGKRNM